MCEHLVDAEFTADLDAPRRVRALLRSALAEFQFSDDLIERGTLTASELAANAVLHARTPFRLLVQPRASVGVDRGRGPCPTQAIDRTSLVVPRTDWG